MTEFPIRRVDGGRAEKAEDTGTKPKFWYREGDRRLLFKADARGTGEDWAEVVACHLCRLLGLPHVEYELADDCAENPARPGVVCENMVPPLFSLYAGNQLLLAIDPEYPIRQRFKVHRYAINAVREAIALLQPPAETWSRGLPDGVETALDVFVGYVMLDAWIANQDRHHENWGVLWSGGELHLAPSFDHGASLARNLLDSERRERLTTKDRNRTVSAYASRGRSAFYGPVDDSRPLGLRDAFSSFAALAPMAGQAWLDRLETVKPDAVSGILNRVPATRMSDVCKQFTMELLATNQHCLLELGTKR